MDEQQLFSSEETENTAPERDLYSYREASEFTGVSKGGIYASVHEERPVKGYPFHQWAVRDPETGKVKGLDIPREVTDRPPVPGNHSQTTGERPAGRTNERRDMPRPGTGGSAASPGAQSPWTGFLRSELDRVKDQLREERRRVQKLQEELREKDRTIARLEAKAARENPSDRERTLELKQKELEYEIQRLRDRSGLADTLRHLAESPFGEKLGEGLGQLGSGGLLALLRRQQQGQLPAGPSQESASSGLASAGQQTVRRQIAARLVQFAESGASGPEILQWIGDLENEVVNVSADDWIRILTTALNAAQERNIPVERIAPIAEAAADRFGLSDMLARMETEEVVETLFGYIEQTSDDRPQLAGYIRAIVRTLKS